MFARIYQPAKTAMQSGRGKTKRWVLEFDATAAREVEPLMGWTSSSDTQHSQVRLFFDTKEKAVSYATRHKIAHEVVEGDEERTRAGKSYTDNFAFGRVETWTH